MQNAGRKKGGEEAEFKRGAWREVMKHRDVCVDPGNDELASLAFQPPFTMQGNSTPVRLLFTRLLSSRDNSVSYLALAPLDSCQILTH